MKFHNAGPGNHLFKRKAAEARRRKEAKGKGFLSAPLRLCVFAFELESGCVTERTLSGVPSF